MYFTHPIQVYRVDYYLVDCLLLELTDYSLNIVSWQQLCAFFIHASISYINIFKYRKYSNISYSVDPWVPAKAFCPCKTCKTYLYSELS